MPLDTKRKRVLFAALCVVSAGVGIWLAGRTPWDPVPKPPWLLLNGLFFLGWLVLAAAAHELAHALVARLMGLRVYLILIGSGPPLVSTRVRGTRLLIRLVPFSGAAVLAPGKGRMTRAALLLTYLAGPLTHVLFAGLGAAVLGGEYLRDVLLGVQFRGGSAAGAMFICANALWLVNNLIPRRVAGAFGSTGSDGWHLLRLAFRPQGELGSRETAGDVLDSFDLIWEGRFEDTIRHCDDALRRHPGNWALRNNRAVAMLHVGRFAEARREFLAMLDQEDQDPGGQRAVLQNNAAFADALLGGPELPDRGQGDPLEERSTAEDASLKDGTRGAILVQQGRLAEARRHLTASYESELQLCARASTACWLAVAEARAGRPDKAERWLARARKACPSTALIAWAQRHVDAAAESGEGPPQ